MKLSAPIHRLKRQAKLLARKTNAPLHDALDHTAQQEGYRSWSHLAAGWPTSLSAVQIFSRLGVGDLMLLGARRGQGKTLLALELAICAAQSGRPSYFFSLEEHAAAISDHVRGLGHPAELLTIDTSDSICAAHVAGRIGKGERNAFAVIDYLQLLDQKRSNPELAVQVTELSSLAQATDSTVVVMSQIDRSFELIRADSFQSGSYPQELK